MIKETLSIHVQKPLRTRIVRRSDYSPAIELSEQKDKLETATGETEKYSDEQVDKVWTQKFCLFILYEQKQNLTSIKSCNSATNLRKMTLYNPNLDLININVYTIFGLILFILCQDIEQNQILTSIKGRNPKNLRKTKLYNPKINLINDNVHTKFG